MVSRIQLPNSHARVDAQGTAGLDTSVDQPPGYLVVSAGQQYIDPSITWNGKPTWRLQNDHPAGGNAIWQIPFSTTVSGTGKKPSFWIPIYVHDYTKHYSPQFDLRIGSSWSNRIRHIWGISATGGEHRRRNGWHFLHVTPSTWTSEHGSPNYHNAIEGLQLQIGNEPSSTGAALNVGPPIVGIRTRPKLMFYADDVFQSFHLLARPVFNKYGIKVHYGIARDWVGRDDGQGNNFCTLANLQEAFAEGHYMCTHSTGQIGVGLNYETVDEAIADLRYNRDYVRDVIGDTKNCYHKVWANGRYHILGRSDDRVLIAAKEQLGMVTGRCGDRPNTFDFGTMLGTERPEGVRHLQTLMMMGLWGDTSDYSETEMIGAVDGLINGDGVAGISFHDVSDTGGPSVKSSMSRLDTFLAHVARRRDEGSLELPAAVDLPHTGRPLLSGLRAT